MKYIIDTALGSIEIVTQDQVRHNDRPYATLKVFKRRDPDAFPHEFEDKEVTMPLTEYQCGQLESVFRAIS